MPARTFERGIEDIERAERSNISTQGVGAVPYGLSEPVFNFMGQAPGQSIQGAYGQTGQQVWNPYLQQQFQPVSQVFGQQPWNVYGQSAQLPWSVYGQQQQVTPGIAAQYAQSLGAGQPFGQVQFNPFTQTPMSQLGQIPFSQFGQVPFTHQIPFGQFGQVPFGQFGQPNVFANPYVNPYAQIAPYSQFTQQPIHPLAQQSFLPFAQSAVHPFAQQLTNPLMQQLPISQLASQQYNPLLQQAIHPFAQQFAHPFASLGFFSGVGQSQQSVPYNLPISQQIPGIFGQHPASGIQTNPLLQSTLGTLQSPISQLFNPISQFGLTQQTPWSQISPYQYSQLAKLSQTQFPGYAQMGQFGRTSGVQSQTLARAPKGYKRPDDRIKDDIIERLISLPEIDASDMEIVVKDGEVTLRGSVEDRNVKRICEEIAESIFGVRDVLNELRVNPKYMTPGSKEREQELTGAAATRGKEK